MAVGRGWTARHPGSRRPHYSVSTRDPGPPTTPREGGMFVASRIQSPARRPSRHPSPRSCATDPGYAASVGSFSATASRWCPAGACLPPSRQPTPTSRSVLPLTSAPTRPRSEGSQAAPARGAPPCSARVPPVARPTHAPPTPPPARASLRPPCGRPRAPGDTRGVRRSCGAHTNLRHPRLHTSRRDSPQPPLALEDGRCAHFQPPLLPVCAYTPRHSGVCDLRLSACVQEPSVGRCRLSRRRAPSSKRLWAEALSGGACLCSPDCYRRPRAAGGGGTDQQESSHIVAPSLLPPRPFFVGLPFPGWAWCRGAPGRVAAPPPPLRPVRPPRTPPPRRARPATAGGAAAGRDGGGTCLPASG